MPKKSGLLVIAVTGTPGTGKTTFAQELSKATGLKPVEVNDIVEEKRLFTGEDEHGSKIVKMQELKKEIKEIIKKTPPESRAVILVGHLLADLQLDYDIAAVTRVGLRELVKRLEQRKYPMDKLRENLVSESIDYCGVQAAEKSKEAYEIETESDKKQLSEYIKERLSGQSPAKPNLPDINKLEEMLELVYEGNTYGL
jgi:adenylate kinase